jgi:AcrR family transcriptional regulator
MFTDVNMVHSSRTALPRPSARERRRAEAAKRIADGAEALVLAGGFGALTMHRLARELGYTVGALYRYYPSKEALVLAVLARGLDALHAEWVAAGGRVDAHLARTRGLEPEDAALLRLLVAFAGYECFAERRPEQFRMLSSWLGDARALSASSVGALVTPSLLGPVRHLRGLFEAAGSVGALARGDERRRSVLTWGALHGALQMRRLAGLGIPDFAATPLGPPLLESLLVAWGADPERVAALQGRAGRLARSAA